MFFETETLKKFKCCFNMLQLQINKTWKLQTGKKAAKSNKRS